MICPDESAVLRYLAGEARDRAPVIEEHVDQCPECRAWVGALARTSLGLPPRPTEQPIAPRPGEFLPAGAELGRYRIVRVQGHGGIGVVYLAEDPRLRRRVALKVLRAAVAETDAPRLLAEARAMARLSHPNVCPVLDVGVVDGRWFLAMALVEGGTLAAWLAEGDHPRAQIIARFVQAGRGLVAAHQVGLVHRDFKPSNVLLDAEGRALMSDFGLALDPLLGAPAGGGTPHYMAPEQRDARAHARVDARADQYAFGVALRDALAGHDLPPAMHRALQRATQTDPDERFATMAALLDAIAWADRPRARRWFAVVVGVATVGALVVGLPVVASDPTTGAHPNAPPQESDAVRQGLVDAVALDRAGDIPGGAQLIDDVIAIAETRGDEAGLATARIARGEHLAKRGRIAEATVELEHAFHAAARIGRDDLAADAAVGRVHLLAIELANPDEATLWARHLEATLARAEGLDGARTAALEAALGTIDEAQGANEHARDRYLRAVTLLQELGPDHDEEFGSALSRLAQIEAVLGEFTAAREHFARAIDVATATHGAESTVVAGMWGNRAFVEREAGDFPAARAHLERARATLSRTLGEDHMDVVAIDSNLAALWMQQDRHVEAIALVERALPRAPADMRVTCVLHEQLGLSRLAMGEPEPARTALRAAIACYDRALGPGSEEARLAETDLAALAAAGPDGRASALLVPESR